MWVSQAIFQIEEGKGEREEMMTNVVNETFVLTEERFSRKTIFLPFAVTEGASVGGKHQTESNSSIIFYFFLFMVEFP